MISEEICHTNPIVVSKVKRAIAEAKRLEQDDSDEDENAPPGTQRKPTQIDDDDEDDDLPTQRKGAAARIKAEKASRGLSVVPSTYPEEQTGDFEDDDEPDEDTGFADDD